MGKPTGRPNGRPPIKLDKELFEEACSLCCTEEEIARLCKCSVDTLERWCKREYQLSFADIYKRNSERGKMSLRRNQLRLSETNATMAIWLGKQWLGQRDDNSNGTNGGQPEAMTIEIRDCRKKNE